MAEAAAIHIIPAPERRRRLRIATGGTEGADLVLLALAAQWRAARAAESRLPMVNASPVMLARVTDLLGDMREAELAMAQMPARTVPGLRAKAQALMAHLPCSATGAILDTATEDQWLTWSLCRDLLGLPLPPAAGGRGA